jgi:hypothetical protein
VLRLELRIFQDPGKGTLSVLLPVALKNCKHHDAKSRSKAPSRVTASLAGLHDALYRQRCPASSTGDAPALEGWRLQRPAIVHGSQDFRGVGTAPAGRIVLIADYHLDGETGLEGDRKDSRAIHGKDMPAVLVTADHSSEVRAAARPARRAGAQQAAGSPRRCAR